jgi:uncharacterized protein (TIGR03382 family)
MRLAWLALPIVIAAPAVAEAHIQLTSPLPRTLSQKTGPCGDTTTPRSSNPTVLEPGATITVTWNETINHPGHYRVSFDTEGQDFTVPLGFEDTTQTENVLVDSIADAAGGSYTQEITLPNVECETCTLQLIQMMTDKPPYGDGNDIYFQCADIALRAGGGGLDPVGPDAGPSGGGGDDDDDDDSGDGSGGGADAVGGCTAGGDGTTFAFVAGVLGSIVLLRRRGRGVAPKRTER